MFIGRKKRYLASGGESRAPEVSACVALSPRLQWTSRALIALAEVQGMPGAQAGPVTACMWGSEAAL